MKVHGGVDSTSSGGRINVGIADWAVTDAGATLSTSGLGSCLGVALYDDVAGVAGLVHVMLPEADPSAENPAKFTDSGIELLLREVVAAGASFDDVVAKLAGGSRMFEFDSQARSIGERNVAVARETLELEGVPLVAEDVGGDYGRSLRLSGASGDLVVKSATAGDVQL
ncbi:MAG: chemotaxis protein CheD [Haloferacaceae archaeon]